MLENKYDLIDDRAETLVRAGRKDEALALLAAAMKDKPGNATLLNNSCWTKGLADLDLAIALKECSKSIELTEEPTGQLHSRALVYFRMKRYDESMADIEAAEKMGSASANFYYLRGIVSSWLGDQVKALADIETAKYLNEHITEVYDAAGIKPKT